MIGEGIALQNHQISRMETPCFHQHCFATRHLHDLPSKSRTAQVCNEQWGGNSALLLLNFVFNSLNI
jgi:hypothetical protein